MGLHNSNICRLFKILEPLLANKVTIKIIKIITDVTEQPTQRPKKKRHTIKTEIVVEEQGRILSVSRMAPGKRHDFRIRKVRIKVEHKIRDLWILINFISGWPRRKNRGSP